MAADNIGNVILQWIQNNWHWILSAIGVGGGSGIAGHKMIDKKQDKRLSLLERSTASHTKDLNAIKENLSTHKEAIADVKKDLEFNHSRDQDTKEYIKEFKAEVNTRFSKMEEIQSTRHSELMGLIIKVIK